MTTILRNGTNEHIQCLGTYFNPAVGEEFQIGVPYGFRKLPRKFRVVRKHVLIPWDHMSSYASPPESTLYVEEVKLTEEEAEMAKRELRARAQRHGNALPEGEW